METAKKNIILVLLLLSASGLLSCAAGVPDRPGQGHFERPAGRAVSPAEIYANFERLRGKAVPVAGKFMGWSVCRNRTGMRTRSDWVLSDGASCIYVTGGFPPGMDPLNKSDIGLDVNFRARISGGAEGAFLILIK